MDEPFVFEPANDLYDEELYLCLMDTMPADDAQGWVPAYAFEIVIRETHEPVGEINLRVGDIDTLFFAGNIGYTIDQAHRGHRYASKACRLLLPLARRHGLRRVLITCNPGNLASRRTAELLGAQLAGIEPISPEHDMYRQGEREVCRYVLEL